MSWFVAPRALLHTPPPPSRAAPPASHITRTQSPRAESTTRKAAEGAARPNDRDLRAPGVAGRAVAKCSRLTSGRAGSLPGSPPAGPVVRTGLGGSEAVSGPREAPGQTAFEAVEPKKPEKREEQYLQSKYLTGTSIAKKGMNRFNPPLSRPPDLLCFFRVRDATDLVSRRGAALLRTCHGPASCRPFARLSQHATHEASGLDGAHRDYADWSGPPRLGRLRSRSAGPWAVPHPVSRPILQLQRLVTHRSLRNGGLLSSELQNTVNMCLTSASHLCWYVRRSPGSRGDRRIADGQSKQPWNS